MVNTLSFYT